MPTKKEHIQFRMDEEASELLRNEAKRMGCGLNEAARYLLNRALLHTDSKIESQLRLSATTAYQLTNFIVEIMRTGNPELSEDELIMLVNERIFTPSRQKTEKFLHSIGLGQKYE